MGAQKVSRKWLSEQTGISRPSLANKLDGKVPFTYDEFGRVVAALDLDWGLLLAETPAGSPIVETTRHDTTRHDEEGGNSPPARRGLGNLRPHPGAPLI